MPGSAWRHCHDLAQALEATRAHIVLLTTNGDAAASLVEVRCD